MNVVSSGKEAAGAGLCKCQVRRAIFSSQADMDTELLIVTIVKALVELAGFFLLGQGLLHLFAGKKREQNLAYQILCVLTGPVIRVTRGITPKAVVDRHIPLVAFLILFWIWVLLSWAKGQICSTVENRCEPDASPAATAEPGVVSYLRASGAEFAELTYPRSPGHHRN